jgi:hypothetical protein
MTSSAQLSLHPHPSHLAIDAAADVGVQVYTDDELNASVMPAFNDGVWYKPGSPGDPGGWVGGWVRWGIDFEPVINHAVKV